MSTTTHRIAHKIVLRADLKLTSPLRIGNGAGDFTQLAILRDALGRPYLPGSSLAGVLRARWMDEIDLKEAKSLGYASRAFWGTTAAEDKDRPSKSSQSHFHIADMLILGTHPQAVVRDGVRIDAATGTVDGNGKYDYELLEPGAQFPFQAEVTVREGIDIADILAIVSWLQTTLQTDLQVGGNTTKGFGRLAASGFTAWLLDFTGEQRVAHAQAWIAFCESGNVPASVLPVQFSDLKLPVLPHHGLQQVRLVATFSLKSSLMIRGDGSTDLDTDKAHLTCAGKPIISGKSLVGAMRHRATRIVHSLDIPEQQLDDLFGPLRGKDENEEPIKQKRSRLYTDEVILTEAGHHMKQTRIRVDRFTAAPVDGGLFDSAPLWRKQDGTFTLTWRIRKPRAWDIALLIHLLRDLWTGDLPIGGEKNVGRGVLQGHHATLTLPDKDIVTFEQKGDNLTVTGLEHLTPYNLPLKDLVSTTSLQ
jgi:CRISPR/Cas system CSM-associated protein Csm3 (group 7 of RAMP superfamily)